MYKGHSIKWWLTCTVIKEVEQGNRRPFVSRSKLRALKKNSAIEETAEHHSSKESLDAESAGGVAGKNKSPGFY